MKPEGARCERIRDWCASLMICGFEMEAKGISGGGLVVILDDDVAVLFSLLMLLLLLLLLVTPRIFPSSPSSLFGS